MHVTLFSRLTEKNNMKGSIGTTIGIVAIEESPGCCLFPPIFLFVSFSCFFLCAIGANLVWTKEKRWAGGGINHGIVDVDGY